MIDFAALEAAGWTRHELDWEESIGCSGLFTHENERTRMTLKFGRDIVLTTRPETARLDLVFTLRFKDHWLHCDLNSVPDTWSLDDVNEYVRRAYLLLNAIPLPRPE